MLQYKHTQPLLLESGAKLLGVEVAYHTYGHLQPDGANAIWICHALTANSDAADWWKGLIGPGAAIDTNRYFVVCANVLGGCYGTTGPASHDPETGEPYFHRFPRITIRDMVTLHRELKVHLGIKRFQMLLGGSLGGQQALEWAIEEPDVAEKLCLIATNARHSPWGIAWNEAQRMAIAADPGWRRSHPDAGMNGLKAARAMALLSYRNYQAYNSSQWDPDEDALGDYKAISYQQYQGQKLANRFNAYTYTTLSHAMDSHNVGRGRGGVAAALERITAQTKVIGITSDVLFPLKEQVCLARHITGAQLEAIHSLHGHDGFLTEVRQLSNILKQFLFNKTEHLDWLIHQQERA